MAEYKWDDAKFFEMLGSAWNDEKFNQLGVKNGIATMEREPSREKLARAFMMACGHSFEDTYDQSTEKRMERFAFGKQFTALLETASGSKSEISEQERAQMLADMGRKFLQANPSAQDRLNDRIRTEGVAYFGDRQWAGWLGRASAEPRAQHSWGRRRGGVHSPLRTPVQAPGLMPVPCTCSVRTRPIQAELRSEQRRGALWAHGCWALTLTGAQVSEKPRKRRSGRWFLPKAFCRLLSPPVKGSTGNVEVVEG